MNKMKRETHTRALVEAASSRWKEAKTDEERRECAHVALWGLLELGTDVYGNDAMAPIQALMAALRTLGDGGKPSLLAPSVSRPGAPSRELSAITRKAAIGAAVEILHRGGMSLPDAAQHVHVVRPQISKKEALRARSDVRGKVIGAQARTLFHEALADAETERQRGHPPRAVADALLKRFA